MNDRSEQRQRSGELRERARVRLGRGHADPDTLASHDVRELLEELQLHKVELEIQNEELREAQAELAESRDRYRELYNAAPVGYLTLDGDAIVELNRAACEILGDTHEHLVGARFTDFVAPESIEEHQRHRDQPLAQNATNVCELALHNLRGDRWYVRVESRAAKDDRPAGCHCAIVDISARKQAEHQLTQTNAELERRVTERTAELQRNEAYLRTILDTTPDAVVAIGTGGRIVDANPATEGMFGTPRSELVNLHFSALLAQPYAREFDELLQGKAASADRQTDLEADRGAAPEYPITCREIIARGSGGVPFPVEASVAYAQRVSLFVVALRDLSHAKQLEHEVLTAGEAERVRIGRELHDSVGQQLAGLAMSGRTLARRVETEGAAIAEEVGQFSVRLQEATRDLRQVVHDLAPVDLEHGDIRRALADLTEEAEQSSGITCTLEGDFDQLDLAASTAMQLVRIAREAVHNAVKHAAPTCIEIRLEVDESIRLTVRDDGCGIESARMNDGRPGGEGIGLRSMQYRANLIGAMLAIEQPHEAGTQVTCTLTR